MSDTMIDDLLAAKKELERASSRLLCGCVLHPADLQSLRRSEATTIPEFAWTAFAGIPVITSTKIARGQYRAAYTYDEWAALQEEFA